MIHVAGVERLTELVGVYLGVERRKLVDVLYEMVEVERLQRPRHRVAAHADGASRVDEEHPAV